MNPMQIGNIMHTSATKMRPHNIPSPGESSEANGRIVRREKSALEARDVIVARV